MMIYRGDCYWIRVNDAEGCEQQKTRPGIVVSNDLNNKFSTVVEVVFITTKDKTNIPTHFKFAEDSNLQGTVLCEQVMSVSTTRIGEFVGRCADYELEGINKCLKISLGLR